MLHLEACHMHLCTPRPALQLLAWAVVEEHAASEQRLGAALAALPGRLAELEEAQQELQREHAALQQATDDKVGAQSLLGLVAPAAELVVKPRLLWSDDHMPPPLPPLVQGQFIANYNERTNELAAELDALKHQHKAAHRAVKLAAAKIERLRNTLLDATAQKEVSGGMGRGYQGTGDPASNTEQQLGCKTTASGS